MKRVQLTTMLVTLYLLFLLLTPFIEIPSVFIFCMAMGLPFLMILIVYVVLKHGKPSKYTFKERFYDDVKNLNIRSQPGLFSLS